MKKKASGITIPDPAEPTITGIPMSTTDGYCQFTGKFVDGVSEVVNSMMFMGSNSLASSGTCDYELKTTGGNINFKIMKYADSTPIVEIDDFSPGETDGSFSVPAVKDIIYIIFSRLDLSEEVTYDLKIIF